MFTGTYGGDVDGDAGRSRGTRVFVERQTDNSGRERERLDRNMQTDDWKQHGDGWDGQSTAHTHTPTGGRPSKCLLYLVRESYGATAVQLQCEQGNEKSQQRRA